MDLGKNGMGDLLKFRDEHDEVQALLPWRANGTLNPAEAAMVEAHLEACAECRGDLAESAAQRRAYQEAASEAPRGVDGAFAPRPRSAFPRPRRFLARRVTIGGALAGQAAVAAAAAVAIFLAPVSKPKQEYRLLASAAPAPAGNAIVQFAPGASEADMRQLLLRAGARMIDGPTAGGGYVIALPPAARSGALAQLRGSTSVLLAEPLDRAAP